MNNNKINIGSILISFIMVVIVMLSESSCKKSDDTYRNYQNTAGNFNGTALQYLKSQPGVYDSMLLILNRLPRIADTLTNQEVTLFAVSNRSFAISLQNINQARHDSIPAMLPVSFSTIDSTVLDRFFCRYVLQGKTMSNELAGFTDGLLFPTISYKNDNGNDTTYKMQMQYARTNASGFVGGGPKAIIYSDPRGSIFYVNWIRVKTITVDIKTTNAVVDILPPGHDFGFGDEFIKAVNQR